MNVLNAILKRYSCRSYDDRAIERGKLDLVYEAARLAPSAKNLQDWRFVAVTDPKLKEQIAAAANNQMFIAQAGVILVACSVCKETMRCGQRIGPIDVAIALDHISLQAAELGLASCWIGSFYPDKIRPILGIPEDVEIVELMAIGYPVGQAKPRSRQPLDAILCHETWAF